MELAFSFFNLLLAEGTFELLLDTVLFAVALLETSNKGLPLLSLPSFMASFFGALLPFILFFGVGVFLFFSFLKLGSLFLFVYFPILFL